MEQDSEDARGRRTGGKSGQCRSGSKALRRYKMLEDGINKSIDKKFSSLQVRKRYIRKRKFQAKCLTYLK
jgi:molybdenum-dependent DNA-binding transcriptional regulator ModE